MAIDYKNMTSAYLEVLGLNKKEEVLEETLEEETLEERKSCKKEDNTNDVSDDGEGMDKVQPKALKKKFDDRKDKDIDNDGDEDESDEYLHNRRKAVSKAVKNEAKESDEVCDSCGKEPCECDDEKEKDVVEPQKESVELESVEEVSEDKSYKITIPGRGFATVSARSEKEAKEKAMRKLGIGSIGKKRLKPGNNTQVQHEDQDEDMKVETTEAFEPKELKADKPTANHKSDPITRDNWVDQLKKRKGEKDFVDMHKVETDDKYDHEKVNVQNFKSFAADVKAAPKRPADQATGDKSIVKSGK